MNGPQPFQQFLQRLVFPQRLFVLQLAAQQMVVKKLVQTLASPQFYGGYPHHSVV